MNDFLPHGYCLQWSPSLIWTMVISDGLISASYLSMPIALGYFAKQRKDFPYIRVLCLFAAFILACGATHLMEMVVLWKPLYWLETLVKAVTATVSVITAVALWPLMPQVLRLPNPIELRQANARLQAEIAEREWVEAALKAANEALERGLEAERGRSASIIEYSGDAIIGRSLTGTINSWNPAAERIFGYAAPEVIGRPMGEVFPPDPAAARGERDLEARAARGELVHHVETVRLCKEGHRIFVSETVSPIKDHLGKVVGISTIARDITERKRAEEALRSSNRNKDEFLAILAHELRNPLAPIRNSLSLLRRAGRVDERVRVMMERQVNHLVRLVDDLLEVSRITHGKIELQKSFVELDSVIGSAVEISQSRIDAERHKLTLELPAEPLSLEADPVRLIQVFANLLNNAAKYMEPGGEIRLSARRQDGMAVVSVRDAGIGIAADALPGVFDMFAQVDPIGDRNKSGLGIGLALSRGLIQLHGGRIEAHSGGLGQGSEFIVSLPLAARRPEARTEALPARPLPRGGRRILVADDNRDAADSLGLLLDSFGMRTRIAYDGRAALKTLESFPADIALLDIGMPGIDGYEVARSIRREAGPGAPVLIALTGWGQEEDRRRSREAGFDHHLIKPVDIDTLIALLTCLEDRRPVG